MSATISSSPAYQISKWTNESALAEADVLDGVAAINCQIPTSGTEDKTWSEYDKHISSGLKRDDTSLYIAVSKVGEKVIAYATVTKQESCSRLRLIAVDPKLRGQGIFQKFIDTIFASGVERLTLSLRSADTPAAKRAFRAYDKLNSQGYEVNGLHPSDEEKKKLPQFRNGDLRLQLSIQKKV